MCYKITNSIIITKLKFRDDIGRPYSCMIFMIGSPYICKDLILFVFVSLIL
jgi:hypothetical protein